MKLFEYLGNQLLKIVFGIFILISNQLFAQVELTSEMMEEYAFRFSIDEENILSKEAQEKWISYIGDNQFVGLAEIHRSVQKGIFTDAILGVLKEKGFDNFALEVGPNSANILSEFSNSDNFNEEIRTINRHYGRRNKPPIPFVNKKQDAVFMQKAFDLGYNIWGLDQEYIYAAEMLLDRLYGLQETPTNSQKTNYEDAKKLIRKYRFRNKVRGTYLSCWYQSNQIINTSLDALGGTPETDKIISDLRESWDIYCKSATGVGSNQQRANYMKQNFESYYSSQEESKPKVFLKLGNIHLTRGISPFRVDDLGKFLTEKAEENETGFLSIRQMVAYRNGKSLIGKPGWESVGMFLELGKKDEWTVVDLRPLREKLINDVIKTNEKYTFEILSYDLLLLPPNDSFDKVNY